MSEAVEERRSGQCVPVRYVGEIGLAVGVGHPGRRAGVPDAAEGQLVGRARQAPVAAAPPAAARHPLLLLLLREAPGDRRRARRLLLARSAEVEESYPENKACSIRLKWYVFFYTTRSFYEYI